MTKEKGGMKMTALRKMIKKSYASVVIASLLFILFNYCGLSSFEVAHADGHDDHHKTEQVSSHSSEDHHASASHTHVSDRSDHDGAHHSGSKEKNEAERFCCPSTFCCSTINIDAELRDQLYYFFLEASAHTALTPVAAVARNHPFKVQKIAWLHDIGPPQALFQIPFYIKLHPTHAPPLS